MITVTDGIVRVNGIKIFADRNGLYSNGRELRNRTLEQVKQLAGIESKPIQSKVTQVTQHKPKDVTQVTQVQRKASESARAKMSEKKQGELNPKFKGFYIIDGVQYPSANLASKVIKKPAKTIIDWCMKGKNGFSFVKSVEIK